MITIGIRKCPKTMTYEERVNKLNRKKKLLK